MTEHVDLAKLPIYRGLWLAVIKQALDDALSLGEHNEMNRRIARRWFQLAGKDFQEVCGLAGVNFESVAERALIEIANARKVLTNGRPSNSIEYNGKIYSTKEFAELTGASITRINERVKRGLTGQALVDSLKSKARGAIYTYKGKSQTVREWSTELGLAMNVIQYRIRACWPIDDVFGLSLHEGKRVAYAKQAAKRNAANKCAKAAKSAKRSQKTALTLEGMADD